MNISIISIGNSIGTVPRFFHDAQMYQKCCWGTEQVTSQQGSMINRLEVCMPSTRRICLELCFREFPHFKSEIPIQHMREPYAESETYAPLKCQAFTYFAHCRRQKTYPLVNVSMTMKTKHVQWVNPLCLQPCSIAMSNSERVT